MAFSNAFLALRKSGRNFVLPTEKIQRIIADKAYLANGEIIDMGAGTLYWSYWLVQQFNQKVLAVDIYYGKTPEIVRNGNNIELWSDYFSCVAQNDVSMIWMFDVVHHLDKKFIRELFCMFLFIDYGLICGFLIRISYKCVCICAARLGRRVERKRTFAKSAA